MNQYVEKIRQGDFSGLPIADTSTAVNLTGSWKFFRPRLVEKLSPCRQSCPLQIPIADWLLAVNRDDTNKAEGILGRANPMPAITGRVCPHFCQNACNRAVLDEEIKIGDLERFLGDRLLERPAAATTAITRPEKIAVIGAGPAGLAAAWHLSGQGYPVTVFESRPEPGGLLRYGIPAYRLPREILDRQLAKMTAERPFEIICKRHLGPGDINQLQTEYTEIIWATGAGGSRLPVAGPGIFGALEVLAEISQGNIIGGERFLIVGGGNAALDTARSLLRLGKKVEISYRRSLDEMPAYADEKEQALTEGLIIHPHTLPGEVSYEPKFTVKLHQAENQAGRITAGKPLQDLELDGLIFAIGQQSGIELDSDRHLLVGDLASGPASVAAALASGLRSAAELAARLENRPGENGREDTAVAGPDEIHPDYYEVRAAARPAELAPDTRARNFDEIRAALSDSQLTAEAGRCFHCGTCTTCGMCWFFCPDVAIAINPEAETAAGRILFDESHCKGCGQCAVVCPRGVIEMEEDH